MADKDYERGEGAFPFYAQLKRALRRITTDIAAHVAASDPHPGYVTTAELAATKLDDLATPDDNTDLNASTSRHGLLRKLSNVATEYLDGTGAWSTPAGSGGGGGGGFPVNYDKWDPDAAPASPNAEDDEFADAAGAGAPSGWTEIDHGAHTTVSEESYGLRLSQATHAGNSLAGVYKAIPAGDFTMWTKVHLSGLSEQNTIAAGMGLLEDATSSTGDMVTFSLHQNGTQTSVTVETRADYATFTATVQNIAVTVDAGINMVYLRIRRTGTTYAFDFSTDGILWQRIHSGTISFTPAQIGLLMNNENTGADAAAVFQFFRYTASDVGITGVMGGNRITSPAATTLYMPDAPPASAGADDDEFADAAGAGVPSGWTEVDHGTTTTVSEEEYGLKLLQATHAGDSVAGVYKAIPAGDFSIVTKVQLSGLAEANFVVGGLALFQDATSATGDIATHTLHQDATATAINVETWTAYNAFGASVQQVIWSTDGGPTHVYLRIRRTGTTYAFDFSTDGVAFQRLHSGTLSFTPAHYGLVVNNVASGQNVAAIFPFFRYVASDVGIVGVMGGDRVRVFRA